MNVRKQVGLKMKHVNLTKSNFSGSMKFYWILWAIDALKLYCLPVILLWLLCPESPGTRLHLSISYLVCWISSLLALIFGAVGIFLAREYFFPKGLTKHNQNYATILLISGVAPMLLQIYFWCMARNYEKLKREDDSSFSR